MASVVRFTLPSARDLFIPTVGQFVAGVLDVNPADTDLLERTRFRTQPYGVIEIGMVDSATPKPILPAYPGALSPDPFPQYPTMDEIVSAPELRAAFDAWYAEKTNGAA